MKEAVATLESIVRLGTVDALAFANLGNYYWQLRRVADAKACFEKALAKNAAHADALNGMGIVFLEDAGGTDVDMMSKALFHSRAMHLTQVHSPILFF